MFKLFIFAACVVAVTASGYAHAPVLTQVAVQKTVAVPTVSLLLFFFCSNKSHDFILFSFLCQ